MSSCNCTQCSDFSVFIDEMRSGISENQMLARRYAILLADLYRSFMCKYPIGSYLKAKVGDTEVEGTISSYQENSDNHILVYLRDDDNTVRNYLIEDVAESLTETTAELQLDNEFNEYDNSVVELAKCMQTTRRLESQFSDRFRLMYPVGSQVGFYSKTATVLEYKDSNLVKIKIGSDESALPIVDLYSAMLHHNAMVG